MLFNPLGRWILFSLSLDSFQVNKGRQKNANEHLLYLYPLKTEYFNKFFAQFLTRLSPLSRMQQNSIILNNIGK